MASHENLTPPQPRYLGLMRQLESGLYVPGDPPGEDHPLVVFRPPEVVVGEGAVWMGSDFGYPSLAGIAGQTEAGEPVEVISYEWAEPIRFTHDRERTEEHHLERFNTDHVRGLGKRAFDSFARGANPPDFVIESDGVPSNLDVTHLVLEKRARAHAIFNVVREAALARGLGSFRHLRGHLVYVLSVDNGAGLPRRVPDVLNAVMSLRPRPAGASATDTNPFGDNIPAIREWGMAIAWPLRKAMPSHFFALMGFELIHVEADLIRESEAWAALQHVVSRHDKPEIDTLLVTVGAPIRNGFTFPSDRLVARLALKKLEAGATITPTYLTDVFVHQWPMRAIYRIRPRLPGYELLTWDESRLAGQRGQWSKTAEFRTGDDGKLEVIKPERHSPL